MSIWRRTATAVAGLAVGISTAVAGAAPVVSNGGFEADTYTGNGGGTAAQNGSVVTDWTFNQADNVGINPIWTDSTRTTQKGSPHANNGEVPEGDQVGWLRRHGELHQTISGFTPGRRYAVTYRESSRDNNGDGAFQIDLGNNNIVADHPTSPVGGSNPYRYLTSDVFTATSTDHTLKLKSTSGEDHSVLVDDVRIATIIHQDSFTLGDGTGSDNAALNGTAAEYSIVNGGTWAAGSNIQFGTDAGEDFVDRSGFGHSGALGYTPTGDDQVLTLSSRLYPGVGGDWSAIGFRKAHSQGHINSSTGGVLWVLIRAQGNYVLHAGEAGGAAKIIGGDLPIAAQDFNDVSLQWDRRENTVTLHINGELIISGLDLNVAAGGADGIFNPMVNGVGFTFSSGANDGSANAARIDDFQLMSVMGTAVPEPASALLLIPTLWVCRRRA